MFQLQDYMNEHQKRVNDALQAQFLQAETGNETIYESVRYSLDAGGKRVRPILAFATARALGKSAEQVMPVALALEMIHTYSLIHDDLPAMDNDDLRRGKPTNHKVYGDACAILAGDALLTKAFEVLACAPSMKMDVIREIAQASGMDGMVGGQMMDLQAEDKSVSLEHLERIHRHKTGALIRCSVTAAAKLCDAGAEEFEDLSCYGRAIGLAFQIADDILDIEGGAEIGKTIGSDLNKEKSTYPKIMGLAESKAKAKQVMQEALQALERFGEKGLALQEIAKFIVERSY